MNDLFPNDKDLLCSKVCEAPKKTASNNSCTHTKKDAGDVLISSLGRKRMCGSDKISPRGSSYLCGRNKIANYAMAVIPNFFTSVSRISLTVDNTNLY